jgi:hypothetical protein
MSSPLFCHFLISPNIRLSALFSDTLSLCSSPSVKDQVSHSYKTTGKIMVLYILISVILETICFLNNLGPR